MNRRLHYFALLTALSFACILFSCSRDEPATGQGPVIRPVRSQEVVPASTVRVRSFSGVSQAGVTSKLSFKVPGTMSRLPVKTGDRVTAGQVIAEIDPTDYHLRVGEAEAALARATAQAHNTEANYDRVRALYENNNASRNDLDAARAAAESTGAEVRSIEKRLELTRLQVSYTTLKAPVAGAISDVSAEINENLAAGQAIVILSSGSAPEVKVAVPELLIADMREGSRAAVHFDAIPEREFSATVTEVGVSPGRMATTFPVTVRMDRPDSRVRPGMAAEVAFTFGDPGGQDRYIVPTHAVAEDRGGRHVYVVEPADPGFGTVHRRPVGIGQLTEGGLEILEGLTGGERVVTAGITRLADGMKVRLTE